MSHAKGAQGTGAAMRQTRTADRVVPGPNQDLKNTHPGENSVRPEKRVPDSAEKLSYLRAHLRLFRRSY